MRQEFWDARAALVRGCFDAGMNVKQSAEHLGLTASTVAKYRKLHGLPTRREAAVRPSPFHARLAAIRDCADRGLTRQQTADELDLCYATVVRYGLDNGVQFERQQGSGGDVHDATRAEAMAAMYRGGKTLKEIGDLYGVSRERVRQVIKKHYGLVGADGGAAVLTERNRQIRAARRGAKCLAVNGCTYAQLASLRKLARQMIADGVGEYRTPIRAFNSQRQNAKVRGIEWKMTLWEWWTFWQESGLWDQRGRGQGYMMCRFGDVGPYAIGNVYIATGVHNGKFQPNNPYRADHPQHDEVAGELKARRRPARRRLGASLHSVNRGLPRGVTIHKASGRFVAQASIDGRNKYLGCFPTAEAAHAVYCAAISGPEQARAA